MELRHLRYFLAVAEEENVTRAAARLHVSQPPLSRQIHDLEDELGVLLFERTGKAIKLSLAGRAFLEEARACLQRVEEAVASVRAVAAGRQGELHLGYAPTPAAEILPRLLRALQQQLPCVRVVLHDHSSPEMLAGLREGRLQAALMMQPSKPAGRGLQFEKLRTYPVGVAVPPRHPFAKRRRISAEDACLQPIVAYVRRDYPDYHEFVARAVGPKARILRIVEECDSGSSLAAAVAAGRGISVCASVFTVTAGRRLKFIPLHPAPRPAIVGLAYLPGKSPSIIGTLVELARSLARE